LIDGGICEHIAEQIGLSIAPQQKDLKRFETSGGQTKTLNAVREFMNVRKLDADGWEWLKQRATEAADTKHSVVDILNVMLEELAHHRYELPAFSTLDRMAFGAREASNSKHFASITNQLDEKTKDLIDSLLKVEPGESVSGWQMLKREPKRPTNKETRSYLQHVKRLQHLVELLPRPEIPVPKLRQFRHLARAMDAAEMTELKPLKRYALAVILIRTRHAQALDDAAEMLIRMMQNLENSARQKLLEFQQDRLQKTDMLIGQLRDILDAYQINGTDTQRVQAIGSTLKADVEALVLDCDELLAYAGRNYLPFLLQPYKAVRAQLLNCVEITAPKCSSDDTTMESMIDALHRLRTSRSQTATLSELNLDVGSLKWMPAQWRKLVFVDLENAHDAIIDRRYFELAVFQQIKEDLKSGDLYIKHGERYDDYREQLVDDNTLAAELEDYGRVTGIETTPSALVDILRQQLLAKTQQIDDAFPKNAHAEIIDGRLILKKPARSELSAATVELEQELTQRMVSTGIVDVLTDVE